MSNVNLHSFRVARLEVFARDTAARLGEATGFFCRLHQRTFLVTNWHVVSGRHFQTRQALHYSRALPGSLTVHAHVTRAGDVANIPSASTAFRLTLLDPEGRPRWLEHPLFGADIDVIALDIGSAPPLGTQVCPIAGRDRQEPSEFEAELGIVWPFRACLLPVLEAYFDVLQRPARPASGS